MRKQKMLSWLLSAAMLAGMVSVSAEGESNQVYKASDAWYEGTADGDEVNTYNGNTIWTWERDDSGVVQPLKVFHKARIGFSMKPGDVLQNRPSGPAWTTAKGDGTHPAVGEGWMKPYALSGKNDDAYSVSRVFKAPADGLYELSTEDGYIYGGSLKPGEKGHRTAFVRITKTDAAGNETVVWPFNGAELRIPETQTQDYKFEPFRVALSTSEVLRFSVYNGSDIEGDIDYSESDDKNYNRSGKYVYWKPVVSAIDKAGAKAVYTSSDAWPAEGTESADNMKNDDSVWKWLYKNSSTVGTASPYQPLTKTGANSTHLYIKPVDDAGNPAYLERGTANVDKIRVYYAGAKANAGENSAMSRWWMRTAYTGNENNSLVKAFTAPMSGNVSISAVDLGGLKRIIARRLSTTETSGAEVKITKRTSDGTVKDTLLTNKFTFKEVTASTNSTATYTFPEGGINTYIYEGEQLWFEVNAVDAATGNAKFVFWNPTVTYNNITSPSLSPEKPVFTNAQGEPLETYAAVTGAGNVNISLKASAVDFDAANGIMCAALFASDGTLKNIALSAQTPISTGENNFEITDMKIDNVSDGYIKIFLLDSLNTLRPLCGIGNTPVLEAPGFAGLSTNAGFKGISERAGEDEAVCILKNSADAVTEDNILFIDQRKADSAGAFNIPVPSACINGGAVISSSPGRLCSPEIPIYCSDLGSVNGDGTEANPYSSLQKALEAAEDGGKVIIDGKITVPGDFAWPVSDKTVTISGINNAMLDIKVISNLDIRSNAVFENLTIGCTSEGTGKNMTAKNTVTANGYHVIIKDTVSTETVLKLRGGSANADVESTNLEVYGGNYQQIYGGGATCNVLGDCRLTVGGNVNSAFSVNDSDSSFYETVIHGGSWGGIVKGDCITTLKNNARAAYVYGGTHGQKTSHVEGKIKVNIEGGSYMNVFAAAFITEGKRITSEINMTGGTVESLFASDNPLTGDITIKVLGGEVTRRIYSGCYNNYGFDGYSTDSYVKGSTTIVLGPEARLITQKIANRGIFAGSRRGSKAPDEINKIIFTGGSYESFKPLIGEQGNFGVCDSYHDYLVAAGVGGNVSSSGAASVSVVPDAGLSAYVNGVMLGGEACDLTAPETIIEFKPAAPFVKVLGYTSGTEKSEITVGYQSALPAPVIMIAVYDSDGRLVCSSFKSVAADKDSAVTDVLCSLDDGKKYTVKAMLWSGADKMIPECASDEKIIG